MNKKSLLILPVLLLTLAACDQLEETPTTGTEDSTGSVTESDGGTTPEDTTTTYPPHEHEYDYEGGVKPSSDGRHHGYICTICGLADPDGDVYAGHNATEAGVCTVCGVTGLNVSGFYYEVDPDTGYYYVERYDSTNYSAKEVFVPLTHDGYDVTGVGIPGSTTQYDSAFWENEGHEELEFVSLSTNITTINNYAFHCCYSLQEVYIPNTVTKLGNYAFGACQNIIEYNIPDSVTEIGNYAFTANSILKTFTFPSEITKIGEYCFKQCYELEEVILPENLETIGEDAFEDCRALKSIDLPESLQLIERDAFLYCYSLESITIPDSVTAWGTSESKSGHTFQYCTSLKEVKLPSSITSIATWMFAYCYTLPEITIPVSVTSIADSAFHECTALQTVYFEGTEAQWNQITISETNNSALTNANIVCTGTTD